VKHGRCELHQSEREFKRDPAVQRLYDRRWQRRRAAHLAAHPWCERCLRGGMYVPATDVHHVLPHRGDPIVFMTSELESLCHSCHSKMTANEVNGRGAEKVLDGGLSSVGDLRREKMSPIKNG